MDSPGRQEVAEVLGAKATEQQQAAEASRLRREQRKAAMMEPEAAVPAAAATAAAAAGAPDEVDLLGSFAAPAPAASPAPATENFLLGDFSSPVLGSPAASLAPPAATSSADAGVDLLAMFGSPAAAAEAPPAAPAAAAASSQRPTMKINIDPEAMHDAAIATALGGADPAPGGAELDLPIDAQAQAEAVVTKPSMRIDLDPEAVSDAAIMSALGGESVGVTLTGEMPIDADRIFLQDTSTSTLYSLKPSLAQIDIDPEAVSDAAIMSALGGDSGGSGVSGEMPIDAQEEPAKPTMRIELDPEAVSDAAIMSALGGAGGGDVAGEMPIDAQPEAAAPGSASASSNGGSPSNDMLRATLGITTLDPDAFGQEAAATAAAAAVPAATDTPGSAGNDSEGAEPPGSAGNDSEGAEPVCLVAQDGAKLSLAPEGMDLLQSLGSVPIAVLCVAGNYRTGKSFFLNQLAGVKGRKHTAAAKASGFHVGNDTESCTRGVWVWLVPEEVWTHPSDPTARLLLMDTEGLASIDQDETWDAKVFSLGILLSSIFVYNNMGVIDEGAIDRLFLVGELTKNICVSANQTGEEGGEEEASTQTEAELAQFFPPFMWLLRDFSLHMKKGGEEISHTEYLEQALANRPGTSSRVSAGNRIRSSFRTLFSERECRTLVRPAVDEDSLRNLDSLDPSKLRPEFVKEMASIRENLLTRVAPKELYGERVTAAMLGGLVRSYTDAINDGGVPDIKKSWNYVVDETMRQAHDASVKALRDSLHTLSMQGVGGKLPSAGEFARAAHSLRTTAHEAFNGGCGASIGGSIEAQPWRCSLDEEYGRLFDQAYQQLDNASTIACTELLQPLVQAILEEPANEGRFDSPESSGAKAATSMGQAVIEELLVQFAQQGHGPATASAVASVLTARLPALYTNLARRADTAAAQAVAVAENQADVELAQSKTLREALKASMAAEAAVSARLEMLEATLGQLQADTQVAMAAAAKSVGFAEAAKDKGEQAASLSAELETEQLRRLHLEKTLEKMFKEMEIHEAEPELAPEPVNGGAAAAPVPPPQPELGDIADGDDAATPGRLKALLSWRPRQAAGRAGTPMESPPPRE